MKRGVLTLLALPLLLAAAALQARADRNPDFNDDAKPILRMQPGLLRYVEHTFEVRDTGLARIPGDEGRPPLPPFIFQARPRGASGAYFITLLIQPGPQGRILKVVDSTRPHGRPPGMAPPTQEPPPQGGPSGPQDSGPYQPDGSPPPPPQQAPPAQESPQNQQPNSTPSDNGSPNEPTSSTPSGPIMSDNSSAKLPPPPNQAPSLAPPPDAAPSH
jgi:hippurate hydrolase